MNSDSVEQVLIVDDDSIDQKIAKRHLSSVLKGDARIHIAETLQVATQILADCRIDVILLDLNLRESSGLEVLDAVRQCCQNVPIVVLSGLSDQDTALRSLDRGAQDYLVKGQFTTDSLARALGYAIHRQQLTRELTRSQRLVEEKNQRLTDLYKTAQRFVDNVSHEFRTPLTVIREYAAIVRDGLTTSAEQSNELLDVVIDRVDDLNIMVDDLLDVSKLEAGMLGVERMPQVVQEIVDRGVASLKHKAKVKRIQLTVDLESDLPQVFCDFEKTQRILLNLVGNAIKFAGVDGQVTIAARLTSEQDAVEISVSDNGPGICEESLQLIFERFRQVQSDVRETTKGFGLGLNIAKELVDLNLGAMSVESEPGQGSTFKFSLPVNDPLLIAQRYIQRINALQPNEQTVCSLQATLIDPDSPEAEDVGSVLCGMVRRNDLVLPLGPGTWCVFLVLQPEVGLSRFLQRVDETWESINRNRIHGALPAVRLKHVDTLQLPCAPTRMQSHLLSSFSRPETCNV